MIEGMPVVNERVNHFATHGGTELRQPATKVWLISTDSSGKFIQITGPRTYLARKGLRPFGEALEPVNKTAHECGTD